MARTNVIGQPWDAFTGEHGLVEVFAQTPVGMAVLEGRELRYAFANPKYQQIIGNRDPKGKRLVEMFPELAGSEIESIIVRVFDSGVPFAATDLLVRFDSQGTGEIDNYYDLSYHPLVAASNIPRGVLVIAVDVTERHALRERELLLGAAETARAAAEAGLGQLGEVFRQAPSFLAIYRGVQHVYAMANEAYYQLIGQGRDIIGKPLLEALPEVAGQGFDVLLDTVLRTGEPFVANEIPVRLERAAGAAPDDRIVSLTYLPLVDAAGERVGVIAHGADVTEYVLARQAVERLLDESETARTEADHARNAADAARAEAEAANRAKAEFLAVMSHELRTPLNAIGGYAELLEMGIRGALTEEQREDLHRIKQSQRHLLGLIDQVLNHARIGTATVRYHISDIPVTRALAAAEALTVPQAQVRGLGYAIGMCDAALTVRADAEKLQQILLNLLSNAIKFTDAGGSITTACGREGDHVTIAVTDTGIGIAQDKLKTIFDPFVQVNASLTRTHSGVGLGLAISRDLARGMGGDVSVRSTPGAGSTFTLVLPAA